MVVVMVVMVVVVISIVLMCNAIDGAPKSSGQYLIGQRGSLWWIFMH